MPIRVQGLKVTLLVPHFSIAGIILDASLIPVPQNQATAAAEQGVATYLNSLNGQAPDIPTLATRFRAWYNAIVRPDLLRGQGGGADSTLLAAISENDEWLQTLVITDVLNSLNLQLLDALRSELIEDKLLILRLTTTGITQSNATCRAQPTTLAGQTDALIAASNALFWQTIAKKYGVDAPSVDQTTVLAGLCVQLDLQSIIFPTQLTVGQTVPLQVRAGVKIAAQSLLAANLVNVTIQPAGAVVASGQPSSGGTQASGFFDTPVTVQQGAVVINVHSCVDNSRALFLSLICKDTLITRSNQPVVNGRYTGLIANALVDASVTLSGNALSGNWTETSGSDRFNRVGIAGSFAGTVSGTSIGNFTLSQTSAATCQVTLPGSASILRVSEINGVVDGPCFTTNATWFIRLKALGTATFVHGLYRCATVGCESFDIRQVSVVQFGDSLYVTTGDNVDAGLFRGKLVGTTFTGIGAGKNAQCTLGSGCVDDATRTITGTVDGSSFSGTQTTPAGTLTISGKKIP